MYQHPHFKHNTDQTNFKMSIPNYCSPPSLQYLKRKILEGRFYYNMIGLYELRHYEEDVSSWATTLLKKVFSEDEWILTPYKKDIHTSKKPDLRIEKFEEYNKPYLLMEVKKHKGDSIQKTLNQTTTKLHTWMDSSVVDVYVVIQRGTKLGFFEFHPNSYNAEETTDTVGFCTSLTQTFFLNGEEKTIMQNLPFNLEKIVPLSDYPIPCVFDLEKHEREINFLFHYMKNNPPRQGPDMEDYANIYTALIPIIRAV